MVADRVARIAAAAALVLAAGGTARADGDPPLLDAGDLDITSAFELDFTRDEPHAPLWVPGARYGISSQLTLGGYATVPTTGQDSPLCGACDHPRGGAFADAAYRAVESGSAQLAARVRLGSAAIDRFHAAITVGAIGRAGSDRFWIDADPHLSMGITGRNEGNEDFVNLPVWLNARPATWLRVYVHTGYRAPLAAVTDSFYVPLGAGVVVPIGRWEAGVEGLFPRVIGPLNSGRVRTAFAFLRFRLPR